MTMIELDRDVPTGLALLRDSSDPPRYYVQERRRRDLLSIGNLTTASERFVSWVERQEAGDTDKPRSPQE